MPLPPPLPSNFTQINFNQSTGQPAPTPEPVATILVSLGIFFSSLALLFLTFYLSPELRSLLRKRKA